MSAPGEFAPLRGVRIVDFSVNIAGPYATMILAQLGAEVIHVEPPQGDDSRLWAGVGDVSIVHRQMGAGKRSIVIDLKRPDGVEVALTLIASASVVLQSMRPGVAERVGIGESASRARNPDILYYDVNAFGSGPIGKPLPGYDPLVQAFTGIMEMTGHPGSPPARCAPSIIDLGTGQWVAMGIMAALMARMQGRQVKTVETALIDTAFSVVGYQATTARLTGRRPPRAGSGNPIAAPYQCYKARDGYLMIAAANQRLWLKVVDALAAPELLQDERFANVGARSRNNAALDVALTAIFGNEDVATWVARLRIAGVPVTPVHGLEESVVSDVAAERGTFVDSGAIPLVRLPWRFDGEAIGYPRQAPGLGEHTNEILREAGYTAEAIAALAASGAVRDLADQSRRQA